MLKEILEKKLKKDVNYLKNLWKKYDTGTMSAFRSGRDCNKGKKYTYSENVKRNKLLKKELQKRGYEVIDIYGGYIENFGSDNPIEVNEESFFVADINNRGDLEKSLIELGEKFEQDSIAFAKANSDYYLISTNKCPDAFPGFGKIGVKIKLGKFNVGKTEQDEFYSKIGNEYFVFK